MKQQIKSFLNKIKLPSIIITLGFIIGLCVAIALSGCAGEPQVVIKPVEKKIPVKIKLDTMTYYKVMQLPKIFYVEQPTADELYDYIIDLQNKYLLLRNIFYNTIEVDGGK